MSYTLLRNGMPAPIRLLRVEVSGRARLFKPFVPADWEVDACAPSDRRVSITRDSGAVDYYHWWEVFLPDDDARTMRDKVLHALRVDRAERVVAKAQRELRRLVGKP